MYPSTARMVGKVEPLYIFLSLSFIFYFLFFFPVSCLNVKEVTKGMDYRKVSVTFSRELLVRIATDIEALQ